jgi:hypothetical protein
VVWESTERKGFADFSVPHVKAYGAIFVRAGDSDIASEEELQGKSLAEKEAAVAELAKKRSELKAKIAELETARRKHVEAEKAKTGLVEEKSLDSELMKSTKKTAAKKGYKF